MVSRRVAVVVVLAGLAAAGGWIATTANDAPRYGSAARNAWREVEQQFRIRAEMVPQIVAMVETVNPTQQPLVATLREAQTKVLAMAPDPQATTEPARFRTFMDTQDQLSRALGKVMDLMNLYPDRRSNPDIRRTLAALETSENRIVVARSDFVNMARRYNAVVATVPGRWMTEMFHGTQPRMVDTFEPARNG